MSIKAKRLVKGSVLRIVEFFASAIVGLTLMPFIINSLGDKMYGLWIFIGSFLGYYGLMDFGLNLSVQKFISESIGKKDKEEINKIINTALLIFLVIGFLALLVSIICAYIAPFVIKNITEIFLFKLVILILGLNFAIGFPLRVFSGVLSANLRYDLRAIIELAKLFLRTILIIIFLKKGFGIVSIALITAIMDIGAYLAIYFLVKYIYKSVIVSLRFVDFMKIKTLFSYSAYSFITQIADQLRFNIDNLVIVTFVGLGAVTPYSIGSRLIRYFLEFMGCSIGMTLPIFSQYYGARNNQAIKEKFIFLTKISACLSLLIGGVLIVFGKSFIIFWVGDKYVVSYHILIILLIPFIFDVMQMPGNGVLYGISKHRYYTFSNTAEGIANLLLSVILVKKYGIYGVALGTAIPMFVTKVFIQPIYTCKVIGLKIRDFYLNIIFPIFMVSFLLFLSCWLVTRNVMFQNFINLIIFVIIGSIVLIISLYGVGFTSTEKAYLKKSLFNMASA